MAVAVTVTTAVHAQYVTYNHDSPKQNQVTVMETGTGALSPDLYYSVLHNKYKKSAAAKNSSRSAHLPVSISTTRWTKRKPLIRLWSSGRRSRR